MTTHILNVWQAGKLFGSHQAGLPLDMEGARFRRCPEPLGTWEKASLERRLKQSDGAAVESCRGLEL